MSKFERYSAVGVFGVPLYNPEAQLSLGAVELVKFMRRHDIEPQPLPEDPTDISPYYGEAARFSYWLAYSKEQEQATIDLLPRGSDVGTNEFGGTQFVETATRSITIPTDQDMFALVGRGPRFGDTLCVHELITYTE